MFERTEAKSAAWRMFAAFSFIVAFPVAVEGLRFEHGWPLAKSVIGLVGLIGLLSYAYGFRLGPRLFWAGFATFFSLGLMFKMGQQIAVALAWPSGMPVTKGHSPAVLAFALAASLFVCLALFRQSGLFAGGDDGPRPPRLSRKAVAYGKVFD
jgi:peptidoglycan/LPS O-acetylase OafA/YrhL